MECPICYEAITEETGVVTTSCKHSYHFTCISGWFIKQEKGSCPCCRKEMNEKEDFPAVPADADADEEAESESESEESVCYEVEFTRTQLQAFIASHGGHLTEQMSDAICAVVGVFTQTELNSLLVGNTGQTLSEDEWNRLMERDDSHDDQQEEGQEQGQLRISVRGDERCVYSIIHEAAAAKIQSAWRTQQAVRALVMLKIEGSQAQAN
jgi:hypothetical protein